MTHHRHRTAVRTYPSELEIVTTRMFDAPIGLVFDVLTKPEHVSHWCATGGDKVTICEIDLRVGGNFHTVFVTPDGSECSFRGTYLEIEPPTRLVNTWLFEGWPDAWAVETNSLSEVDGETRLTMTLAFRDKRGPCSHGQGARSRRGEQRRQRTGRQLQRDGGPPGIASRETGRFVKRLQESAGTS